jgi:estrogen-related receptor beta like 1
MPPSKIKSGHGDGVCQVLLRLTMVSMQNKFRFKKPKIKPEVDMDEEGDDNDSMDGGADMADVIHAEENDDGSDIDEEFEFAGGNNLHEEIIQSSISKEQWQLEVEKVAHKLRLNKNLDDGREWRSHLDQTKKHAIAVRNNLPEVRVKLDRLHEDTSK